jgi:anti-sigma factor RsiW
MIGIDDQILMAYLDGELDPVEHARVGQALIADARLRERLVTQRRLGMRLADRYDPIAREDIPEHLREIVEGRAAALV